MVPWRLTVGVFYCFIHTCATQLRNKALFPSAVRTKRGMPSMVNPSFQESMYDVNLLFEILLSGLQFANNGQISLADAELASVRQTRKLEVICEDVLPTDLTEIRRLTYDLSNHIGHLRPEDFERTLLTMVYTVQQVVNSTTIHQKNIWAESFVSLYKAIKHDLIGND